MDKAEEKAWEAFPNPSHWFNEARSQYRQGYEQAVKDILTEIDDRLKKQWEKLPNSSDTLDGNITKEQAYEVGKYNNLEGLQGYIMLEFQ